MELILGPENLKDKEIVLAVRDAVAEHMKKHPEDKRLMIVMDVRKVC